MNYEEGGVILLSEITKVVEFKGTKEGIVLQIKETPDFQNIIDEIRNKLSNSAQFFTGATIIGVEGEITREIDRYNLYDSLSNEFKLNVKSLDPITKVESKPREEPKIHEPRSQEECSINYNEYDTKIVRSTLRSGISIEYDGNILVIGDVNPGAEISAGGNVIVMGKLRGMVHSGKFGNRKTYIIANKLVPTQLRIANVIARAPEDANLDDLKPEIAYLKSGQMSIEEL